MGRDSTVAHKAIEALAERFVEPVEHCFGGQASGSHVAMLAGTLRGMEGDDPVGAFRSLAVQLLLLACS